MTAAVFHSSNEGLVCSTQKFVATQSCIPYTAEPAQTPIFNYLIGVLQMERWFCCQWGVVPHAGGLGNFLRFTLMIALGLRTCFGNSLLYHINGKA